MADDDVLAELTISRDKVWYVIIKAREYDAQVEPVIDDPGSNPADDREAGVLEDRPDDPTAAELRAAIDALNEDEMVELIALAWVGRGDFDGTEWTDAKALAAERHRRRSAGYLMGMPRLGDNLEEGLAALGFAGDEQQAEHL